MTHLACTLYADRACTIARCTNEYTGSKADVMLDYLRAMKDGEPRQGDIIGLYRVDCIVGKGSKALVGSPVPHGAEQCRLLNKLVGDDVFTPRG